MTKIRSCYCTHEEQDKLYGKGMRVFNQTTRSNKTIYRCTVCNRESI